MAGSATNLPNQIPPQSATWGEVDATGKLTIDPNVWLFLYNLASQVLTASTSVVTLPAAVNIPLVDSDIASIDAIQDARRITNALLLQESPDASPTFRDVANVFALASDNLLQDPIARAQPAAAVTVTASPFTYTAPFNGALAISAGTVSAVALIRQGVTVPVGAVAGLISVSRSDQVQITYTVVPTVNFLPS